MNSNSLKRNILLFMLLLVSATFVQAQSGLQIDRAFEQFGHTKGCKMVEMNDATLHGFQLHVYKSLVYKRGGQTIATYLKVDRKNAKKIREVIDDGQITSGYYMMPPTAAGLNRYILFSNSTYSSGTIIYIEGRLSPDDILKLCYSRRR